MKILLTLAIAISLSSCSTPSSTSGHSQKEAVQNFESLMAADKANRHLDSGNYSEAITGFTRAIDNYPTPKTSKGKAILGTFYADRGLAYQRLGNATAAMNNFNQAIEIAPNAPGPHAMRGMVHLKRGDKDFAKDDLQRALKLNPQPKLRSEILQILASL